MFIKRDLIVILIALVAAALIAGCAMMKDSGGDQTETSDIVEQIAQVLNCACHAEYGQWLDSRHADLNNSPNRAGDCIPCHTGYDVIGEYIEPEPKYFVDCASCHEADDMHGAINAGLRGSATSSAGELFNTCTYCHDFDPEETPYGAHHYLDSDRYWENTEGVSAHDAHVIADTHIPVTVSTTTIAAMSFSVFSLPDPDDAAWEGNYAGPYYFVPDRVLKDTHFNEVWILNEDDKVTLFTAPTAKLGYVDLSNTSPNSGMVRADNDENACLASCHNPHTFDKIVQQQWADGPHHPIPVGPIVADDSTVAIASGPPAWDAVDHQGFGAECVRCHNSVGYAEADGEWGDVDLGDWDEEADGFITCNGCHDGENYPIQFNSRLRLDGDATIFTYDGDEDLVVEDAGDSATCIYCHQGRSTGMYVKDDYAYLSTQNFGGSNSHYLAAAGILWTTIGYEYGDSPSQYANVSYFAHDMVGIEDEEDTGTKGPCVTCHMSGEPANHYFSVVVDDELPEICANCHDPAEGHELTVEDVEEEAEAYEEALQILVEEFEADGVWYAGDYPYFFNSSTIGRDYRYDEWTSEEQLGAAFNLNLLAHEPGAFAHNRYYAKRLLFDSIDWVDDGSLDGTITDYSATYPHGAAWLGTERP